MHFFTLPAGRQVRAFGLLWQTSLCSEAEKNFLGVSCKEVKKIMRLNLKSFQTDLLPKLLLLYVTFKSSWPAQ